MIGGGDIITLRGGFTAASQERSKVKLTSRTSVKKLDVPRGQRSEESRELVQRGSSRRVGSKVIVRWWSHKHTLTPSNKTTTLTTQRPRS